MHKVGDHSENTAILRLTLHNTWCRIIVNMIYIAESHKSHELIKSHGLHIYAVESKALYSTGHSTYNKIQ